MRIKGYGFNRVRHDPVSGQARFATRSDFLQQEAERTKIAGDDFMQMVMASFACDLDDLEEASLSELDYDPVCVASAVGRYDAFIDGMLRAIRRQAYTTLSHKFRENSNH